MVQWYNVTQMSYRVMEAFLSGVTFSGVPLIVFLFWFEEHI